MKAAKKKWCKKGTVWGWDYQLSALHFKSGWEGLQSCMNMMYGN